MKMSARRTRTHARDLPASPIVVAHIPAMMVVQQLARPGSQTAQSEENVPLEGRGQPYPYKRRHPFMGILTFMYRTHAKDAVVPRANARRRAFSSPAFISPRLQR